MDGTVYCGGSDGRVFALSPAGQLKWSVPLGGEISGTPALAADGSLYVGTGGRRVFRVSDQGQVLGEFDTEHGVQGSPLIRPDGDVLVSDGSRTLYLLEGASSPGGGPWPTHLQNAWRTGRAWASPLVTLAAKRNGNMNSPVWQAAACSRVLFLAACIELAKQANGGGKMSRAEHQALR
jgi:hypothetical protein